MIKRIAIAVILLFALLMVFTVLMSSCSIDMFKKKTSSDSTSLKKEVAIDTSKKENGSVNKNNSISREEFDWFRTTMQYAPKGDTVTNNIYPQTVIYEGGRGKKEQETNTIDSNWLKEQIARSMQKTDSTSASTTSKEKSSETQVLGLWHIIGACIGTALLILILQYASKFKITKKINV